MDAKMQVLAVEQGNAKKGGLWTSLICLDVSEHPMLNTFNFQLSQHDAETVGDVSKLKGQILEAAILEIQPGFGGRMNFRGMLQLGKKK